METSNFSLEDTWIDRAKNIKEFMVGEFEKSDLKEKYAGDVPPIVFVEKDSEILCHVIAPEVDKDLGLFSAFCLRKTFDPDVLVMVIDAHTTLFKGRSKEEIKETIDRFASNPGSLRRASEEGNFKEGEISECICVLRINREGDIDFATLPYNYYGKGSGFIWLDEHLNIMDSKGDDQLEGNIPESLRRIMKDKNLYEECEGSDDDNLKALRSMGEDMTEEDRAMHSGRAALMYLAQKKFYVMFGKKLASYGPLPGCKEF